MSKPTEPAAATGTPAAPTENNRTKPEKVKVTFQILRSELDTLHGMSKEEGVTDTKMLRRSIRVLHLLHEHARTGGKATLVSANGKTIKEPLLL